MKTSKHQKPSRAASTAQSRRLQRVVRAARRTQSQCPCCEGNGSYPPNLDEPTKLFKCPYCYELLESLKELDANEKCGSNADISDLPKNPKDKYAN